MIAGSEARCERALGWTIDKSEPSARGELPRLGRRQPSVSGVRPHVGVRPGRYVVFQLAEVAVPRSLFADILRRIDRLGPSPRPLLA